ncbi:hypothetical protein [Alteromonas sp. C1M14]|uniref:hypothetical protein n=1 Tax=Alteromonas sp. C1M14 TaxID=2841567 RepID=UPI001C091653|nr:hypothetical protein [Alteromonas sp. C1M14]MBU2977230.1 hypothetical protein [Alteromonas sp. C1M14]
MRVLYIHPGWSKTGTSAIQSALCQHSTSLQEQGILYPESVRWTDGSHHTFAWAFSKQDAVYSNDYTAADVIEMVYEEMTQKGCHSLLLSSELSPVYLNNPRFKQWCDKTFDKVEVIFTVRRQSELVVSLYNQLIKDPNVRYKASLHTLIFNNLNWLNFKESILNWTKFVGDENIRVLPFSRQIVSEFLELFNINEQLPEDKATVNTSIPNAVLEVVKTYNLDTKSNQEYLEKRDRIINIYKEQQPPLNQMLFSVSEQQALDKHFNPSNQYIAQRFMHRDTLFDNKEYEPVRGLGWPLIMKLLKESGF